MSDIRMAYEYIRVTYELHKKNKMYKSFGAFRLQFSTFFLVKPLLYATAIDFTSQLMSTKQKTKNKLS